MHLLHDLFQLGFQHALVNGFKELGGVAERGRVRQVRHHRKHDQLQVLPHGFLGGVADVGRVPERLEIQAGQQLNGLRKQHGVVAVQNVEELGRVRALAVLKHGRRVHVVHRGARIAVLGEHGGDVGHKIGDDLLKLGRGLGVHGYFAFI